MVFLFSDGYTRTILVDINGSGDFQTIQDAVNVAASGDTIRIAPGRYNDGENWSPPGWTRFVRVMVTVEELTIIGSGPEQTIIGQEEAYSQAQGFDTGIFGGSYWGNQVLRIEDLKFENMGRGIEAGSISELYISNCNFEGNPCGLWGYSDSIICKNSCFSYESNTYNGVLAVFNCSTQCFITECLFSGTSTLIGQTSLYIQGCSNGVIDGCRFIGDRTGAYLVGGHTVVTSCQFDGQDKGGVYFAGGFEESIQIMDCSFENQYTAINTRSFGSMSCENLDIRNVTKSSFLITLPMAGVNIHNCNLAKGERYIIHPYLADTEISNPEKAVHFDMRNNWWATDNPDSIQAWIYDANDDTGVGFIVDWEPFWDDPIPTRKETLGGFKSLFRR
jgi:hypothetical protein